MRTPTKSLLCLALAAALLILPGRAAAVTKIAMRVLDSGNNPIVGGSTLAGYAGWIDATSVQHAVTVPVGTNGQPTGPAQPSPLSISASWDQATVELFQSQAAGAAFPSITLEVIEDGTAKMPMPIVRFELVDANILASSYGFIEGASLFLDVNMQFSFSQITITDIVAGTSATYSWNPASATAPTTVDKGIVLTPSPNPTQGRTEFRFALPRDSDARLALYDIRGYLVRELHNGWTSGTSNVAVWDGTDDHGMRVAQGVYLARLSYPGREVTQRITMLR